MASCRDVEGWRPVSTVRSFDLTPCFEEGIIFSTLLVALIFAAVVKVFLLSTMGNRERSRKSHWVLRGKLALILLAFFSSCANLILVFIQHIPVPVRQSYMLEVIALAMIIFLTYWTHERTRTSSSILLLFWPAYTVGFIIWARTLIATSSSEVLPVLALKCAVVALGIISFALECLSPEQIDAAAHENPVATANIFSIWSFGWMTPLMKKGASEYITENDLPDLLPKDGATKLGDDLKQALDKYGRDGRVRLWRALFVAYGPPYLLAAYLKIVQDCLAFLQPQLLRWLLAYISAYQSAQDGASYGGSPGPSPLQGFTIAVIMFVAAAIQTFILHQYFQLCYETGMRVRSGLVGIIYKKALVLSSDERGRASGDIVNMMSVDAVRLQELCTYGLIVISGPLQITLAFVSLYNLLGWAAFVGVAIMIVSIPLNTLVAQALKKMQEKQMKNRDKRTRLMSELLANIKSIKLYAWEYAFIRKISFVRNQEELKMLKKIGIVTSLNGTMWSGIPLLVAFSSFATAAAISSRPLTSDVIFPAISLFMLLQFPLGMFSQITSSIIEALVSVNRLCGYLEADELQSDARKLVLKANLQIGDKVLSIVNGEFSWNQDAVQPTLEDINLTVKKGELVGILGRVGCGKTSLLSAIVGDMRRTEGEVTVYGSVSYAPQNPWILSTSVRDNILFSHEYDQNFYNLVLDACALRQDLETLPQNDLTEVGEKGITLSGGQRARVSLARAVYARADLVLLDDVLAAVDSHVARHVFDHVIGPHGLLATKARVLVTNSIAFLKQFDRLAFIRRGIILEIDTYDTCMANEQSELRKLVKEHGSGGSHSGGSTPFNKSGTQTPRADGDTTIAPSSLGSSTAEDAEILSEKLSRRKSFGTAALAVTPAIRASSSGLSQEHIEQGRVKRTVYLRYLEAASNVGFSAFLVATLLQQVASVFANITLRNLGEHNRESGDNSGMFYYLLGYGSFSLASIIFSGLAAILLWVLCTVKSARYLHDSMLNSLMRAPLSFFELTPTGRILNLFSRDTYVVDQLLARVIQNLFRTAAVCVSIVVVIGYSFPPFLISVIPLGWFYARVMKYYLATSRELKRLDAVSRSPIYAWFSESLAGLSTIRAFNQQSVFIAKNENCLDRNQMCYLPSTSVNRWLAVRLELVGATIIFVTALLAVTGVITTGVDAGLVGLVLSYALTTTGSLNWLVRSASEVEQNIVSVERILHYVELPSEAPNEVPDTKPANTWPSQGQVEFRQYSCRYRPELSLVLKDVSMTIKPREKIGICGRTGAGKSSLLLALFRIIEPTSGMILIDGVDITEIGLYDLRSGISIVPQSPDLFEGTLRENIDPIGEYPDVDIWVALGQAHLKEYVETLPQGLDAPVHEGGSSLSSGQRQLLCFARALLRKSKVLVLDEATSAVDLDTDKAIQSIIRGPLFANVTMLTIAHRLNTIIESDRVLVLDQGQIAEFDTTQSLLENKGSLFYALAAEAGIVNE